MPRKTRRDAALRPSTRGLASASTRAPICADASAPTLAYVHNARNSTVAGADLRDASKHRTRTSRRRNPDLVALEPRIKRLGNKWIRRALDRERRSATLRAATPVVVSSVHRRTLQEWIARRPETGFGIMCVDAVRTGYPPDLNRRYTSSRPAELAKCRKSESLVINGVR